MMFGKDCELASSSSSLGKLIRALALARCVLSTYQAACLGPEVKFFSPFTHTILTEILHFDTLFVQRTRDARQTF